MTVHISKAELDRLHAHAAQGYPHEVVGILAGDPATGQVLRVVPLINERADSPKNRYQVSGLVLMRAEQRLEAEAPFLRALGAIARAEGLRWGGDWRGHPSVWDAYGLGWDPAHVEVRGC